MELATEPAKALAALASDAAAGVGHRTSGPSGGRRAWTRHDRRRRPSALPASLLTATLLLTTAPFASAQRNNVILFVGDGMGVSTVTMTRIATVGVDGQLALDRMPYTAISRTASADFITPDSAATMSAMMTGVNTNTGVIGFGPQTEYADFNGNGDSQRLRNIGELATSLRYAVLTERRQHP